jgi:hypothetical protein
MQIHEKDAEIESHKEAQVSYEKALEFLTSEMNKAQEALETEKANN